MALQAGCVENRDIEAVLRLGDGVPGAVIARRTPCLYAGDNMTALIDTKLPGNVLVNRLFTRW